MLYDLVGGITEDSLAESEECPEDRQESFCLGCSQVQRQNPDFQQRRLHPFVGPGQMHPKWGFGAG